MKKYLIIATLFLSANIIYMQNGFAQKITGGIEVSPVLSWMAPDIADNIDNEGVKLGFNYGIVGDLNFSDNFAFSTGIMVNSFGGKLKYTDAIPEFTVDLGTKDSIYSFSPGAIVDYKLQYVEIPISLKGKTNEIGYMTYFMKAGISPMFRWKAKGDVTQGNISGKSIKNEVASLNVAFIVGGGFEYSFGGNTKLLFEFVYTNGLSDITKTKVYDDELQKISDESEKVILSNIALRVGILF